MNRLLLCLLLAIPASVAMAQSYALCNQVIGATGKSAVNAGRHFAYTVGEAIISTESSANFTLTQGFHQPDICAIVSAFSPELADWHISVFPNPAEQQFHIQFAANRGQLIATVTDPFGRLIISRQSIQNDYTLDCASWQAGVYFLFLETPANNAFASLRLVKL